MQSWKPACRALIVLTRIGLTSLAPYAKAKSARAERLTDELMHVRRGREIEFAYDRCPCRACFGISSTNDNGLGAPPSSRVSRLPLATLPAIGTHRHYDIECSLRQAGSSPPIPSNVRADQRQPIRTDMADRRGRKAVTPLPSGSHHKRRSRGSR